MKLNLEIRAAEGGDDAKLLMQDQLAMYQAHATLEGFTLRVEEHAPG